MKDFPLVVLNEKKKIMKFKIHKIIASKLLKRDYLFCMSRTRSNCFNTNGIFECVIIEEQI